MSYVIHFCDQGHCDYIRFRDYKEAKYIAQRYDVLNEQGLNDFSHFYKQETDGSVQHLDPWDW